MIALVACSSGNDPGAALQDVLDEAIAELEVDGAAVTVIGATGDRVHAFSGVADRADADVDETTQFAIASVTKVFTTAVAMRLSERGEVDLDAPANLPGLSDDTTLRDLLAHTAGLPYESGTSDTPWTPAVFEAAAARDRPCEPRHCFQYSDLGFVGAGLVLEDAASVPFAELLSREVLDPLELEHTMLVERPTDASEVARIDRHDEPGPVPGYAAVPLRTWTAGAIVTTADDLAGFGRALFDGDLLDPASLGAMQDVERSAPLPCTDRCYVPYGLGLHRTRLGGHETWGHDGSSGAVLAHFPAEKVTIAVLTTRRDSGYAIMQRVMDATPGLEDLTDIYAIDADGSDPRAVISHPGLDGAPAWSPDGERVAFGSVRDGNPEIYVAGIDGDDVQRLTDDPADDLAARWSPDGESLVFASRRDGDLDIYSMRADGSDVVRFTDEAIDEELPMFSPDGQRVAFNTMSSEQDGDIVLVDADGTDRTVLDDPGDDWAATWSPDGDSIAFVRGRGGIWVMAADGSQVRQVSPDGVPDRWPSWGPDDRIAFVLDNDLWTMASDGTDRRQITATPEQEFVPAWSPDGDSLIFPRN
jgi:Tol biopolymer transport system component